MQTASQGLLFDWGDTLMRNYPAYSGAMADWPQVACLPYTLETLSALHKDWIIALATNAADSNEEQIWSALRRVGLEAMIDRVFCSQQLGLQKPDPAYFAAVLERLRLPRSSVIMIGDDFKEDVNGALQSGLRSIWLNEKSAERRNGPGFTTIHSLLELPSALVGLGQGECGSV